jgi:hypothetical protein
VREWRGKLVSVVVGGEGLRSGVVVVVIGGCGHEDVREWGMGVWWCHRLVIVVG